MGNHALAHGSHRLLDNQEENEGGLASSKRWEFLTASHVPSNHYKHFPNEEEDRDSSNNPLNHLNHHSPHDDNDNEDQHAMMMMSRNRRMHLAWSPMHSMLYVITTTS